MFKKVFAKLSNSKNAPQRSLPKARVCFTSLFHLFMDWRSIPDSILKECLIILDCKRAFFMAQCDGNDYDDSHFDTKSELTSSEKALSRLYIVDDTDFQKLIFSKESEGRLLWLDSVNRSDVTMKGLENSNIDQKWITISQWLMTHIDPISNTHYSPIQYSQQWWIKRVNNQIMSRINPPLNYTYPDLLNQFRYCDDIRNILSELRYSQFSFQPTSEILNQINPTLIAMVKWDERRYRNITTLINNAYNIDMDTDKKQSKNIQTTPIRNIVANKVSSDEAKRLDYFAYQMSFAIEDESGFVFLY